MQEARERSPGDRLGLEDGEVHAAIRFAVVATLAGLGFVVLAALWVSTCPGMTGDTVACGAPQRTALALGGPLILLGGGLWAFLRTYLARCEERTWWGWNGAGWFLLGLTMLTASMGAPSIAGPFLAI
ncbi:hypothetical protein BST27_18100 [Mycobacterium intermedium]|uniref:Transmembrane protein n=1 Tax=Mycobacterium intermedium TaxID=28445 RepID=A0A1E3SCV8_MYCIE|nr:hypothetical protein [Mycobacterium intermedium]MCV6962318.1 hypothetical protein [Mycobacterium intermedium]ODQ99407.1 hypothetical protein BHQ20_18010 [Mycobacterium intermedium]OPE51179.1 hypothetical protein BV508_07645 [Mycobacterium intermedium]ORB00880.1 hypothetical protein BST27_18100 [Mycobacterium intermedium]